MFGQISSLLKEALRGGKNKPTHPGISSIHSLPKRSIDDVSRKLKKAVGDFVPSNHENSLPILDNGDMLWHPNNDGKANCPFVWYDSKGRRIISNREDIAHMDLFPYVLRQTLGIMRESYEKNIPVSSFDNFGVRLDAIEPKVKTSVELIFLPDGYESKQASKDPQGAISFLVSQYLKHFLGHNYGDVLRANPELENEARDLYTTLRDKGRLVDVPEDPYEHMRYRQLPEGTRSGDEIFYDFSVEK